MKSLPVIISNYEDLVADDRACVRGPLVDHVRHPGVDPVGPVEEVGGPAHRRLVLQLAASDEDVGLVDL